jgi:predicted 3-demethylubiquinone-9 3-methyltransferase (glyoxalase superfamily)
MPATPAITPCLWFDGKAEEAAAFYVSLFDRSSITHRNRFGGSPSPITVEFELDGCPMVGLNGGPMFRFTPAISMFVMCETAEELDRLWAVLTDGGSVMMPVDRYEWSERYGWGADRFGLTWQLMLGPVAEVGQKVTPCLLFVGDVYGRAEEALNLYTSVFPGSPVDGILRYAPGEPGREGTVKHAQFALAGRKFMVMDGPGEHPFGFNEAVSFVVSCDTQAEIDGYWSRLTADGGAESRCGWLKDPVGVSWQIIPSDVRDILGRPHGAAAIQALMGMGKLDIDTLRSAR